MMRRIVFHTLLITTLMLLFGCSSSGPTEEGECSSSQVVNTDLTRWEGLSYETTTAQAYGILGGEPLYPEGEFTIIDRLFRQEFGAEAWSYVFVPFPRADVIAFLLLKNSENEFNDTLLFEPFIEQTVKITFRYSETNNEDFLMNGWERKCEKLFHPSITVTSIKLVDDEDTKKVTIEEIEQTLDEDYPQGGHSLWLHSTIGTVEKMPNDHPQCPEGYLITDGVHQVLLRDENYSFQFDENLVGRKTKVYFYYNESQATACESAMCNCLTSITVHSLEPIN